MTTAQARREADRRLEPTCVYPKPAVKPRGRQVREVARNRGPHNNALHQTKGAVVRPLRGRSLRAPFAGEGECCAGIE